MSTSFILDAATIEAEKTILDQHVFRLSPEKYRQFLEVMNRPPSSTQKLRKLLSKKPGWQA